MQLIKARSTLIRFQTKMELFCSIFKNICVHAYRFRIVFTRPHYNAVPVLKTLSYLQCTCSNELDACTFQYISPRKGAKLKPRGNVFPPFWILMVESAVEWSGTQLRHRILSYSPCTLENRVFKEHRFQIAPLWKAFWNGSVFDDRFRRCSVDDSRIRSKTAPFSFENGLVWTGPKLLGTECTQKHRFIVKRKYILQDERNLEAF